MLIKLAEVKLNNERKLTELRSIGAQIDPSGLIVQALIEYLVPESDMEQLEFIFQMKIANALDEIEAEIRKKKLMEGINSNPVSNLIIP